MQFTIKDKTFDSGRLNAFQQLHVVRRLAPVTERLVALAGSAGDPEAFRLRVNGVVMFPLDLTMLLGIAAHVLKDNLSGFFADLPSVLNRAGKAAESDG